MIQTEVIRHHEGLIRRKRSSLNREHESDRPFSTRFSRAMAQEQELQQQFDSSAEAELQLPYDNYNKYSRHETERHRERVGREILID